MRFYLAKGEVIIDIPLCDSSSTLMTLHLLYDCYIQLLTLEPPLDTTLHYNAHVLNGLSKLCKTSPTLGPLW